MRRTIRVVTAAIALATVASSAAGQDSNASPNSGTVTLTAGFAPDPRVVSLRAGGGMAASAARAGCAGFITSSPDVRLNYESAALPLIISVDSTADTALLVNAPDGNFYCDDDSGVNGLNPSIRFNNPMRGRYEIWVATYVSGASQPARLHISEVSSQ